MPTLDVGAPVLQYIVEVQDGADWLTVDQTTNLEYSVTQGLITGETYIYRVRAENEVGIGAFSDTNSVIAARVPDAPTVFNLISSTLAEIKFEWNLPYNGGSEITHF